MEGNNFSSNNRLWTGVLFVIVGGLILAAKMGAPIPMWIFSWEMLLIGAGLALGLKHKFRRSGWLVMIVVGMIFLLDGEIPNLNLHEYIVPIIIMAVGVMFIFRPKNGNCKYNRMSGDWNDKWSNRCDNNGGSWQAGSSASTTETGDIIQSTSIFSGVKKIILSKDFKGGSITCVMGGAEIDLTQADINGIVVIRVEQVFGGMKLLVPPHWVVNNEIDGMFHGVEDKRRMQPGMVLDTTKVLLLKGSCVFGGIDIRSY
jgi:predicted membrane protein